MFRSWSDFLKEVCMHSSVSIIWNLISSNKCLFRGGHLVIVKGHQQYLRHHSPLFWIRYFLEVKFFLFEQGHGGPNEWRSRAISSWNKNRFLFPLTIFYNEMFWSWELKHPIKMTPSLAKSIRGETSSYPPAILLKKTQPGKIREEERDQEIEFQAFSKCMTLSPSVIICLLLEIIKPARERGPEGPARWER